METKFNLSDKIFNLTRTPKNRDENADIIMSRDVKECIKRVKQGRFNIRVYDNLEGCFKTIEVISTRFLNKLIGKKLK